jgi:hypothetical protein
MVADQLGNNHRPTMSVSLYAYGGTEHTCRASMGDWTAEELALLRQTSAIFEADGSLAVGHLQIGAMLLLGKRPVLMLRQFQRDIVQRWKPYTLILAPSTEQWQYWGWNAAALALDLFGDKADGRGSLLLTAPEKCSKDLVDGLLNDRSKDIGPFSDPTFCNAWQVALELAGPMRLRGQIMNFLSTEGIAGLAHRLQTLPPSLRFGLGWLAQGTADLVKALGAHVLLDPGDQAWTPRAELGLGGHWPQSGSLADAFTMLPCHEWSSQLAASIPTVFKIGRAAQRLESLPATELDTPMAELAADLPKLAEPLRMEGLHTLALAANRRSGGAGTVGTRALLELAFTTPPPSNIAWPEQYDHDAAMTMFRDRQWSPEQCRSPLPAALVRDAWASTVTGVTSLEEGLLLLRRAATRDLPLDVMQTLIYEVAKQGGGSYTLRNWWQQISMDGPVAKLAAPMLPYLAAVRVVDERKGAAFDYVLLANDPGGAWLAAQEDIRTGDAELRKALNRMVRNLIKCLKPHILNNSIEVEIGHTEEVTHWLQSLELSGLRSLLSMRTKQHLPEAVPTAWKPMHWLISLWLGRQVVPPTNLHEQYQWLQAERDELLRESELGDLPDEPPRLQELVISLGAVDPSLIERSARFDFPNASLEGKDRWARELDGLGQTGAAAALLANRVMTSPLSKVTNNDLHRLKENVPNHFIDWLLRGPPEDQERVFPITRKLIELRGGTLVGYFDQMEAPIDLEFWAAGVTTRWRNLGKVFDQIINALPDRLREAVVNDHMGSQALNFHDHIALLEKSAMDALRGPTTPRQRSIIKWSLSDSGRAQQARSHVQGLMGTAHFQQAAELALGLPAGSAVPIPKASIFHKIAGRLLGSEAPPTIDPD